MQAEEAAWSSEIIGEGEFAAGTDRLIGDAQPYGRGEVGGGFEVEPAGVIGPIDGERARARDAVRAEPDRTVKTIHAQSVAGTIEIRRAPNHNDKDAIRRDVERERSWRREKITDVAKIIQARIGCRVETVQVSGAADGIVGDAQARRIQRDGNAGSAAAVGEGERLKM